MAYTMMTTACALLLMVHIMRTKANDTSGRCRNVIDVVFTCFRTSIDIALFGS